MNPVAFLAARCFQTLYEVTLGCASSPLKKADGAHILEVNMKKIALAAVFALAGTAALAGNLREPVVEPQVVVAHSSSSASGVVVPLLLLVVLAAVAL
jgi:hypothetical protein